MKKKSNYAVTTSVKPGMYSNILGVGCLEQRHSKKLYHTHIFVNFTQKGRSRIICFSPTTQDCLLRTFACMISIWTVPKRFPNSFLQHAEKNIGVLYLALNAIYAMFKN